MDSRTTRLELTVTSHSPSSAPNLRPKRNWLISMGNWGNGDLALENASATAVHPVLWRDDDRAFDDLRATLCRASEVQIRDLVVQRAIRGDAHAQNLAFRSLFAKSKGEINIEPPAPAEPLPAPTPMTREEAGAYIGAGLRAAGIETPDGLDEEVFSKEQWAKWGR